MTEPPFEAMPYTIHGVPVREPVTQIVVTRTRWCWWEAEVPPPKDHGYFSHTSAGFTEAGALRRARRWRRRQERDARRQAEARSYNL